MAVLVRPSLVTVSDPVTVQAASVRAYIDNTLTELLHELSLPPSEGRPSITLRRRSNIATYAINRQNGALEAHSKVLHRTYSWPGNSAYEAWRFCDANGTTDIEEVSHLVQYKRSDIVFIIREIIRDIYYIDPAYFKSQNVVDNIVDDLAYTIGVERAALNVEAAGKGLITGPFTLRRGSQVVMDARFSSQDNLIPRIQEDDEIDISGTRWILIIEKEAVFHRLARDSYHTTALAGQGLLITGKGYPDLCTRAFVHHILCAASSGNRRPPPVYALVDGDPDGISIMSTYKYGSMAHSHENARFVIPNLQYLGLRVSDAVINSELLENISLLALTPRDRRKIVSMLQNSPIWAADGPEPEWRVELQRMMMLNLKAEIEILYEREGGLKGWIDQIMFRQA
ncbi:Winged helix-turn-helix transcription repressor DNA-binding [Penicillium malachiteum]|uniref:Winged helix-turn-helix transcription repressor DNA-binding n=1 Tax=Penicillium malachiteum TaxID=1324776 RepID=UPI00254881A7|nr:Winged helix-turn-helix transcription repressor DNA-binding [Penicillium malachiteum]KAJ5735741.1 Winged helix-turn-helix transcription repressor DNA-binding [Penicillium malachiteum]